MKKLYHLLSATVLTCTLFVISSPPTLACGPSFVDPIFSMATRPENFADYAKGNVGIIQPTFNRSTLVVAYRAFNNLAFSEKEQADLIKNWQAEYENLDTNESDKSTAIGHWITARKKIAGNDSEPEIYTDKNNPTSYSSFLNCTPGAFDNATKTLEARLASYANDQANLKAWLHGQDQVFANCSETKEIPSAVNNGASDWLKADRAYQIAAAHFYAAHYDEAKTNFEQIAKDTTSPWHELATYLLARVAIRQASAISEDKAQHEKMLSYYQQAENQLNNILADSNLAKLHDASSSLLNLIQFRIKPKALHERLAKKLIDGKENSSLFQDITDYRRLLDQASGSIYEEPSEQAKALNRTFSQTAELTDWIFTVQNTDNKQAFSHALEKWQANKNTAWLVVSLMKANADNPEINQLIEASKNIDKASPAFLSATYHIVRLQTALKQSDEARKTLDNLLADTSHFHVSTLNHLLSARLLLAQNTDEFVEFSQRHAASFAEDSMETLLMNLNQKPKDGEEDYYKEERVWVKRVLFDQDATRIMNTQMPLEVLTEIALNKSLPDYLRSRVALSAWVRAILLYEEKTAQKLAPEVGKLIPELKTAIASYSKAKTGKAKTYEAVFAMLKNPATRPLVDTGIGRRAEFSVIENYRDNWWCDSSYLTYLSNIQSEENKKLAATSPPVFLTPEQLKKAQQENAKIQQSAASGSNFLTAKAIEWAEFSPREKRLPEALALAVRATRYGCQNCDTAKLSKTAFDLLNSRFPKSEWKKNVPYWYGDDACQNK